MRRFGVVAAIAAGVAYWPMGAAAQDAIGQAVGNSIIAARRCAEGDPVNEGYRGRVLRWTEQRMAEYAAQAGAPRGRAMARLFALGHVDVSWTVPDGPMGSVAMRAWFAAPAPAGETPLPRYSFRRVAIHVAGDSGSARTVWEARPDGDEAAEPVRFDVDFVQGLWNDWRILRMRSYRPGETAPPLPLPYCRYAAVRVSGGTDLSPEALARRLAQDEARAAAEGAIAGVQ